LKREVFSLNRTLLYHFNLIVILKPIRRDTKMAPNKKKKHEEEEDNFDDEDEDFEDDDFDKFD